MAHATRGSRPPPRAQGSLKADLDLLYGSSRVLELVGITTAELSDVVNVMNS